jgi:hypothetical protein
MKVTLEHPFFENRAATHSQLEEIKEKQEKAEASLNRLEEGQAEIIKMSAVTQQLVKNSTSKVRGWGSGGGGGDGGWGGASSRAKLTTGARERQRHR